MQSADGSKLYDVDGKEYIEFHSSAGPMLFGYNNPRVNAAVAKALELGNLVNFETEYTAELAGLICDIIPCADLVRLFNSGSEATMAALRLARGYTGKDIIIRFEGHFHGMHELIWYNHSPMGQMDEIGEIENVPNSGGFAKCFGDVVKNVSFNDIDALERVVKRYKGEVAAIIMEPIGFNSGCYLPKDGYLAQVRELCDREGIVLIFDEIITGFRIRPGSAQAYYGVTPDLTTLGKALGGGMPIAAIAGKRKVMETFNPIGTVGASGTTSGALMPVIVAVECMKMVQEPGFFDYLEKIGDKLYGGVNDLFEKHGIPGHLRGLGAKFGIYFGVEDWDTVYDWRKVREQFNRERAAEFIRKAIANGLYFHDYGMSPVPQHNGFGVAHTEEDIDEALERIDKIFSELK